MDVCFFSFVLHLKCQKETLNFLHTPISVKWIYKIKQDVDGNVQKNKARLVARGFTQQPNIDFNETFAPVAHMDTVRTVLAIAAQNKWPFYQMDVKSAFSNGYVEEEVYV